jgi:hypothetical protein
LNTIGQRSGVFELGVVSDNFVGECLHGAKIGEMPAVLSTCAFHSTRSQRRPVV